MQIIASIVMAFALSPAWQGVSSIPTPARVPGLLQLDNEPGAETIEAPSAVAPDEPFVVTIRTYGNGCDRPGDVAVIRDRAAATIMVYDLTTATRPGVVCTMVLKRFVHTVIIAFDQPGDATIRVWGRRTGAGLPQAGEPIVLEHRMVVVRRTQQ